MPSLRIPCRPPASLLVGLGVSALSGAAYSLAFPPVGSALAPFCALAPLFAVAARSPPRLAAMAGLVWGIAATAATAAWLPETLVRRFDLSLASAWCGLLAIALVPVGAAMAGLCGWIAWAAQRRVATPFAIAAAFGLAELARANGWPPTPWALLGASELPEIVLARANLVGGFGLGMSVAACNALLASLAAPRLRSWRTAAEAAALIGLAFWAWTSTPRASATEVPGRALLVAVVQPGVETGREREPAARAIALTRALRRQRPDLVVWPEHAFHAYLREDTPASRRVSALSRELGGDLVVGAPHYRYAEPSPRYFASAFLLRGGALVGRHDKTRLVPFAEAEYSAGTHVRPLPGEQLQLGALICAELLFADVSRDLVRGGARLLVNPSNDAWLAPAASEHLLRLARLRAIENRRPLLRATPTGASALIDADGRVLARSSSRGGEVLIGSLRGSSARTLTNRWGDWPLAIAGLAVAAVSVQGARRKDSTRRKHA